MQISVTFDLTKGKKAVIQELDEFFERWDAKESADHIDVASLKGDKKRKKPSKTVSDDEDEDFGTKALKEEDLEEEAEDDEEDEGTRKPKSLRGKKSNARTSDDEDADEADESEEDDESDESDSEDDEESSVTFQEVRAALNKYGEKHPDQAQAILLTFGIKSPKELSAVKNEKHWEGIYRKVMAKIKAGKKRK
jgi:ATP-binding cassette subfamily F protein 2